MSTSLADALLATRPRETRGGPTANRFAYQRTWALCRLLQLHEAANDYVLIMEFHDDVIVLNSSSSPTSADFFQLKTLTDDMWRQKALLALPTKRPTRKAAKIASRGSGDAADVETGASGKNGSPRSILGKLVDHGVRFAAPHVGTLNIVSNAKFDLSVATPPPCREREKACVSELAADAIAQIRANLKAELGLDEEPSLENVYFLTSGISLTEHATHGAGELAGFLERRRPGGKFAVQPLYRALCDELTRRATHEWQPSSFTELCKRKGLDRADVDRLLTAAEARFDPQEQLVAVQDQLARENVPYRQLMLIAQGWRRYQVERMDESNTTVQELRGRVIPLVDRLLAGNGWSTLTELARSVRDAYVTTFGAVELNSEYLEGAILFEFKILEGRQFQAPGAEHAAGTR